MRPPTHPARHLSVRRGLGAVLAVLGLLVATLALPDRAGAALGGDRFLAGQVYRGEFGAPSVLVVGRTYYAFATTGDGHNTPAMTSPDLRTWRARPAYPAGSPYAAQWKNYNDAFPHPASWALYHRYNGQRRTSVWAPSVLQVGRTFVMAYAVPVPSRTGKRCIGIATSTAALGPYQDRSRRPIVCSSDPRGSIDPQLLRAPGGSPYLIWKNAGVPGSTPTKIWSRRLNPSATAFARPSAAHFLLQTHGGWEGNVIEAPAMAYYAHRYYLFYSGNIYTTARYATGYAICAGPSGPCRRVQRGPLLATGGGVAGPGAGVPFVDLHGSLRFAYSAWTAGHVGYPTNRTCLQAKAGCNQRRLHIATLRVGRAGHLAVARRG